MKTRLVNIDSISLAFLVLLHTEKHFLLCRFLLCFWQQQSTKFASGSIRLRLSVWVCCGCVWHHSIVSVCVRVCVCAFVHVCLYARCALRGARLHVDAAGCVSLQVDGLGWLLPRPGVHQSQVPDAARDPRWKLPSCHSSHVRCSACHTETQLFYLDLVKWNVKYKITRFKRERREIRGQHWSQRCK